jgi:hypothetical protein
MIKDMMASNELHILICMLGQASHSQTKSIAIDLLLDHPPKDLDESFHFDIEKERTACRTDRCFPPLEPSLFSSDAAKF